MTAGLFHECFTIRCAFSFGYRLASDPRPCLGDPAFDVIDWVVADGGGERAVQHRIGWLAARVDGRNPDQRAWVWCQAMAMVLAVILFVTG